MCVWYCVRMTQTIPFTNTVSARDIQRNYRKIFDQVKKTQKPIVVISNNKPQAAIVSLEQLAQYEADRRRARMFTLIDSIRERNKNKNPDELYRDITKEVEEVRQKRYEKRAGRR